ncbi:MAG: glycosyltransferase [Candidatus Saccharimonadales bacterium]
MKSLSLTIVIPAYNEQSYLAACLDSIAGQNVMPNEVIVVDNNSSDETLKIAKEYSFVKVLSEKRQGVFFAARKGFKAAKSDVIGRIDADTILPADWIETVLAGLQDKRVAAVTGPVSYYDMPLPHANYWFDHMMRIFTYRFAYQNSPFLYGSNLAIRRKVWRQIAAGLCTQHNIHEDIDLAIHVKEAGHEIVYDKALLSGASGRRYNDGLKSFSGYIGMYRRTYRRHNLHSLAIYPALFMWSLGYVMMHPWRNVWYSLYARLNNFYPISREARKNPMSSL